MTLEIDSICGYLIYNKLLIAKVQWLIINGDLINCHYQYH